MLLTILVVIVLWTWGLTPLWVNIVGTVLIGIKILLYCLKFFIAIMKE